MCVGLTLCLGEFVLCVHPDVASLTLLSGLLMKGVANMRQALELQTLVPAVFYLCSFCSFAFLQSMGLCGVWDTGGFLDKRFMTSLQLAFSRPHSDHDNMFLNNYLSFSLLLSYCAPKVTS